MTDPTLNDEWRALSRQECDRCWVHRPMPQPMWQGVWVPMMDSPRGGMGINQAFGTVRALFNMGKML